MRATGRLVCGVLVLLSAVRVSAQASAENARAASALLARTTVGAEAKVPCDKLNSEIGGALIDLGDRTRAGSLERATTAFRLAERAARCVGSEPLLGRVLNRLSDTLMERGLLNEALATAEAALGIHERLNDKAALAQSWNAISNVRWSHGDMTGALDAQQRSLGLREAVGDRAGQASSFNNIGNIYKVFGRFDESLDYLRRALRIFEELGDRRRAAVVTDNIGVTLFGRGEYTEALEYARRALRIHRELGDRLHAGKDLDTAGNIYKALGAYGAALRSFEAALQVRTELDNKAGVMETLHNIGLVHFAQGDYQLAIDAYLRGLHLNRAIRDQWFSAEALRNLGAAAWRLGQHARAEADFRESLAIARRSRNRPIEAELLDDLGQMALAGGRLAPATRLFSRALDLRTEMADYAGVTESLTSQATARLRAGQPTAALALASRAVSNATTHDQPELLWHAQTVEGIAYRRLHRPGDARRSLLAAVDSIEQLSADLVDRDNLRQRFFENKLSPYHELIAIAMEAHRFEEAVEWAERSRARALAELLGGGRLDDDAILTGDEARERRRLRNAMFTLNRQIDGDTSGRRQDLESARREARDALAAFDATLAARHPELAAARGAVKPFDFADVNACLRDRHTAALEFVVTDTRVFALLAMRTGTGVAVEGRVVDADAATLARLAGRVRDQIGSRDQAFKSTASDLFALLVKPFAAALEGVKTLVIVPDGALWNVPFQALLGPKGYLIESAAIAYAPSLTVLRETEQLPGRTGPPTVLAMGRSRFDAPAAGPSFEQLPEADDQLRAIRDIYGPQRSLTLTGDEANETRLKAMADRFSVLHIATHGVLDEVSPLYSYLLLAPGPNNDDDDGRLEAWEIMHLSLRADLVVLAACDTGRGRIAPGEGVIGMMWALFAAGARSMIVSQFQVEATSATAELIGFHRELAAGSLSSAESLQRAAVRLLHTPRFAHPYYWAGFVLVGDPE